MAKFQYRMQSILDIKYKLEEQAKQEFSAAQIRYQEETERLETLRKSTPASLSETRTDADPRLKVPELQRRTQAVAIMEETLPAQKEVVFRAMAEADKARQKLNQCMQERKTHEKLREHQFEEFLQGLNAEERKEIDELVSYRYSRSEEGD